jgi:hypothetical protein
MASWETTAAGAIAGIVAGASCARQQRREPRRFVPLESPLVPPVHCGLRKRVGTWADGEPSGSSSYGMRKLSR